MNGEAAEAAFRLELVLMREDHADPGVTTDTVDRSIRRVARRYRLDTWFVRGLVEELWKDDVGNGHLKCQVCGRSYSQHPLGHCPDLAGERVLIDPLNPRTVARRKSRART